MLLLRDLVPLGYQRCCRDKKGVSYLIPQKSLSAALTPQRCFTCPRSGVSCSFHWQTWEEPAGCGEGTEMTGHGHEHPVLRLSAAPRLPPPPSSFWKVTEGRSSVTIVLQPPRTRFD